MVEDLIGIPHRCKDPKCGRSMGICGSITAGKGELDPNGYWEFPCKQCEDYFDGALWEENK